MAINEALRRRKGLVVEAASAPAPEAAAVEPGPGAEHLPKPVPVRKTKDQLRAERERVKAIKAEQARIQADIDAARLPPPPQEIIPNGRQLTLHELNQMAQIAAQKLKDENREVVAAVAKATSETLSNVVDRRRHSRAARAADLQRQLDTVNRQAEAQQPQKGEGFVPLYR